MSEAWGRRTSDKFLTGNCGILEKLLPGDMSLQDLRIQRSVCSAIPQIFHPVTKCPTTGLVPNSINTRQSENFTEFPLRGSLKPLKYYTGKQ